MYLRPYDSLLCYDYSVVVPSFGVLPSMAHDPEIGLLVCFGVGLQLIFLSFWHFWGELLLVHELDIGLQSSFHGSRLGAFLSFVQVMFSVWSRVVLPCSFLRNHCYLGG